MSRLWWELAKTEQGEGDSGPERISQWLYSLRGQEGERGQQCLRPFSPRGQLKGNGSKHWPFLHFLGLLAWELHRAAKKPAEPVFFLP